MIHPIIQQDLQTISAASLPWQNLAGQTLLISGAAGMLPAYLVETLLFLNDHGLDPPAKIIGLVRDANRADARFAAYRGRPDLRLIAQDVCQPLDLDASADIIIHAASQASPRYYGVDPVGTLLPNILGAFHLLHAAQRCECRTFLFFSSGEIYGAAHDLADAPVREETLGALDPLDIRSCYPESKRMGETLCVSWMRQFGLPVRIVRPFHTYGPGMRLDDGRVFADFVAAAVRKTPLRLTSAGEARRCFCYLADATRAFFTVLLKGADGQAYNVANPAAELSIAELAELVASLFPDRHLAVERAAAFAPLASRTTRSLPDVSRLAALGWRPTTDPATGFRRTIESFL